MNDEQTLDPTILVIEDRFVARECLAALLRQRGFEAVTAKDGSLALAKLASGVNPAVIVLDMLLPELDGWKFLDELRNSRHRSVPVIVTSGIGLSDEWAADHGCAGFLRKPFDEAELFEAIGRALGLARSPGQRSSERGRSSLR